MTTEQQVLRRVPLYQHAADVLRDLILSGEVSDVLPSQDALAERLQMSRSTIREAIRLLERAGLVSSRQGVGTVINHETPSLRPGLEELMSTTALISRNGYTPGTAFVDVRPVTATRRLHPTFVDQGVVAIERVRTADGLPVVYSVDVIPDRNYDLAELRSAIETGSLMTWFEAQGISTAYAQTTITATAADRMLADRLDVKRGTPLLLTEEIGYDKRDTPVYSSHDFYRCDLTHFHVVRRPR